MVKIRIEVRGGTARFGVAVHAASIARASRLVEERYPAGKVRVVFPTDPDGFFGDDPDALAGKDERPDMSAA